MRNIKQIVHEYREATRKMLTDMSDTGSELYDLQYVLVETFKDHIRGLDSGLKNYSDEEFMLEHGASYMSNINKIINELDMFEVKYDDLCKYGFINDDKTELKILNANTCMLLIKIRNRVPRNGSLLEVERKEILDKVKEIEEIIKLDVSKEETWNKLKPTIQWLATKELAVATIILDLITQIIK